MSKKTARAKSTTILCFILFIVLSACNGSQESTYIGQATEGETSSEIFDDALFGMWELIGVEFLGIFSSPADAKMFAIDEPIDIDVTEYDTFEEYYHILEFQADGTFVTQFNKVIFENDTLRMEDCVLYGTFDINLDVSPPVIVVEVVDVDGAAISLEYQYYVNQLVFGGGDERADIYIRVE